MTSWEPEADDGRLAGRGCRRPVRGLNLWRTARRNARAAEATDCASLDEAADRIVDEVADTYPAFELRGLDWAAICARHRGRLERGDGHPCRGAGLARRAPGLPHLGLARPRQPPVRPRGRTAIESCSRTCRRRRRSRGRRSAGLASDGRRRPRSGRCRAGSPEPRRRPTRVRTWRGGGSSPARPACHAS